MKRLLDLVRVSGCAAKISPLELERYLKEVEFKTSDSIVVGVGDDAGVFKLGDYYIIQTVDFITPVLNDPYLWAQASTANALSDVYAMGGEPVSALAIVCFNNCDMNEKDFELIIKGSMDKLEEAGAFLIGGHTVDDKEPKFGLAVTGYMKREPITQSGAKPGQLLILTKPIGVGVMVKALKDKRIAEDDMGEIVRYLTMLNNRASHLMLELEASACTDVTGFGLLGHLYKMCRASRVGAKIYYDRVPIYEMAINFVKEKLFPKGTYENYKFVAPVLKSKLEDYINYLLCDPVTSGGLLFSIDREREKELLKKAKDMGLDVWIIGEVTEGSELEVL